MRALQLTQWKHEPELREVAHPEVRPGQVLVRRSRVSQRRVRP